MKIFIIILCCLLVAQGYYEWDDNYPEIDPETGWPYYEVNEGDTLGLIAETKYGSSSLWILLKNGNWQQLEETLQDTPLQVPLKIVIPAKRGCVQFMDATCIDLGTIPSAPASSATHDGGKSDNPNENRRFLALEDYSANLQKEIHSFSKSSHSYWVALKKHPQDDIGIDLVIENQSIETFVDWEVLSTTDTLFVTDVPLILSPGKRDHVSFKATDENLAGPMHLVQARILNKNAYLQIFYRLSDLGYPHSRKVMTSPSRITQVDFTYHNSLLYGGRAWGKTSLEGPMKEYSLEVYDFIGDVIYAPGQVRIADSFNLFGVSQNTLWTIKSGTQSLTDGTNTKWQLELIDSFHQLYTISQDGKYLGDSEDAVRLTRSKLESPGDNESFKIIRCYKTTAVEFEISQDENILVFDSSKSQWIMEERGPTPCLRSLSIVKSN